MSMHALVALTIMFRMRNNGFTLLEMMVVLLIISIMAAFALPSYLSITARNHINRALTLPEEYKGTIKQYYRINGSFPSDNAAAGIPEPEHLISNYVKSMTIENGAIHIVIGNKALPKLENKILTLQPLIVTANPTSPIDWNCGYEEPPQGMSTVGENRTTVERRFLPAICN